MKLNPKNVWCSSTKLSAVELFSCQRWMKNDHWHNRTNSVRIFCPSSTYHSCPDRKALNIRIVIALKLLIKSFYQIDTKWYSNKSTIEIWNTICALRPACDMHFHRYISTDFSIIYSINFTYSNIKQRFENNSYSLTSWNASHQSRTSFVVYQ